MESYTQLFILLLFAGLLFAIVVAPVFALYFYWSSWRDKRGYRRFCQAIDAWDSSRNRSTSALVEGHTVRPLFLSLNASKSDIERDLDPQEPGFLSLPRQLPRLSTNGGSVLAIRVDCDFPASFAFTLETLLDKAAKQSGLSVEYQSGDATFDREVYVTCEDFSFLRSYLTTQRRAQILGLLAGDFQQVRYLKHRRELLLCSRAGYLRESTGATAAQAAVSAALSLATSEQPNSQGRLPAVSPQLRASLPSRASTVRASMLQTTLLLILAGVLLLSGPCHQLERQIVSTEPLVSRTLIMALVPIAALVLRALKRSRGTSHAHRYVALTLLRYLISVPLLAFPLVVLGNSLLDPFQPFLEQGSFVTLDSRTYSLPNHTFGEFRVAVLRLSNDDESKIPRLAEVVVSDERAQALLGTPEAPAIVTLKPGLFGLTHAVDFSLDR